MMKEMLETKVGKFLKPFNPKKIKVVEDSIGLVDCICSLTATTNIVGVDIENSQKTYEGRICLI